MKRLLWMVLGLSLGVMACGEDDVGSGAPINAGIDAGTTLKPDGGTRPTSYDNVSACKAWLAKQSCGSFDFSTAMSCETYRGLSCDVSGYFDCLSTKTKCTGGFPDTSGWLECQSKAKCS